MSRLLAAPEFRRQAAARLPRKSPSPVLTKPLLNSHLIGLGVVLLKPVSGPSFKINAVRICSVPFTWYGVYVCVVLICLHVCKHCCRGCGSFLALSAAKHVRGPPVFYDARLGSSRAPGIVLWGPKWRLLDFFQWCAFRLASPRLVAVE